MRVTQLGKLVHSTRTAWAIPIGLSSKMEQHRIVVVPMRQQLNQVREEDDDWTGLTDPAERRKRQNRLHARAWRKRQAAQRKGQAQQDIPKPVPAPPSADQITDLSSLLSAPPSVHQTDSFRPAIASAAPNSTALVVRPPAFTTWASPSQLHDLEKKLTNAIDNVISRRVKTLTQRPSKPGGKYEPYYNYYEYLIAPKSRHPITPPLLPYTTLYSGPDIPKPHLDFPLAPDHALLTLVQYNVLRASMTNMTILRLLDSLPPECGAAAAIYATALSDSSSALVTPRWLEKTPLQIAVPHNQWIDAVPSPNLRDNLIRLSGTFDEDDLCTDMLGGIFEGFSDTEMRGWLVWGDPWLPDSWEISEGFMQKWGYMLHGCHELITATNRWREKRGEDGFVIEL
ncbi:hypothetical protein B0H63DRAFT_478867 [Podospora didyma]|uniref:BZIP domain-containing protein n=1 Tax=Podospora didyma TaxID=330526 RepID=A0AAE0KKT0_9PEZI|nr:hypothetical protein B0H63DRAFT_478867 [Podospora didyma]